MTATIQGESHRTAVAEALTRHEPGVALDVLDAALRWTADVLAEAATDPDDADGRAFGLVEPLAAALARSGELSAVLPRFLTDADAGGPVDAELERRTAELVAESAGVEALRAEIARRTEADRALAEAVRTHRQLQGEVDDLRRAEELAADLPRLTAVREDLVARLGPMRDGVAAAEESLRRAAADFVELTEAQLARLAAETRQGYVAATDRQRELREWLTECEQSTRQRELDRDRLQARLDEARERLATLTADHEALQEELTACAAADSEVSAGLGRLRDAELLLRTVEEKLAGALVVREQRLRQERRPWFHGDPG